MDEERKEQTRKQIKDWLATYYRDFKGQSLNDDELNTIVWNWCERNNLTKLLN